MICWETWIYIQAADVLAPLFAVMILAFSEYDSLIWNNIGHCLQPVHILHTQCYETHYVTFHKMWPITPVNTLGLCGVSSKNKTHYHQKHPITIIFSSLTWNIMLIRQERLIKHWDDSLDNSTSAGWYEAIFSIHKVLRYLKAPVWEVKDKLFKMLLMIK